MLRYFVNRAPGLVFVGLGLELGPNSKARTSSVYKTTICVITTHAGRQLRGCGGSVLTEFGCLSVYPHDF